MNPRSPSTLSANPAVAAAVSDCYTSSVKQSSRRIWLSALASATPIAALLVPFACGFLNLAQGYLMLLGPMLLCGSVLAGFAVAALAQSVGKAARAGLGAMAVIATIALFFVLPAPARTWTIGFATRFQMTKHPAQVQQWASTVLDRFEAGKLSTSTNAPYWAVGRKLDASEVPANISGLWSARPSIGIAEVTADGRIGPASANEADDRKAQRCVAFSWYLSGLLVGRTDFRCAWNPWYVREIAPGIYAYSGTK